MIKKRAVVLDDCTKGGQSTPVAKQPAPVHVRVSPRTLISGSEGITRRNRHVLPEQ